MKRKTLLISTLIFVVILAGCSNKSINLNNKQQKNNKFEQVKLEPVNEIDKNEDFKKFYDKLLNAIEKKDINFIKEHIHENIIFTPHGDYGKEKFFKKWNKEKNISIFDELYHVLTLGGKFTNEEQTIFKAPYIYTNFPETMDKFNFMIVIDKNVPLYKEPSTKSTILKTLSYDIVEFIPEKEEIAKTRFEKISDKNIIFFNRVRTVDNIEGFIESSKIYSPQGYFIEIRKFDDKWLITKFSLGYDTGEPVVNIE